MNQELDFDLLLKLKELEKETNFHFVIDKDNAEIYLFEPNSKESFDKIKIQKELKEIENASLIKQPDSTSVERYTSTIIRRIRSIIGKRIARSEEIQTGSGSICEGYESIYGINGDEIWRRDFEARVSLQELQTRSQRLEETNRLIQQSNFYKQQALKAYQQNGVTPTPNTKNLQNEIVLNESPQKVTSPPDYEAILNADKGFRTEKTIQYTIEQIAKEYHLPIEQVKKEVDRILQRQEKENPKAQESIQSKTQKQEVNQTQESKTLPLKRDSKTIPKPTKEQEQSFSRGR